MRRVVIVETGEGRFEPRQVELGGRGEDWVEILSGLKEGEPVVVAANFLIDAESNLRAALGGLGGVRLAAASHRADGTLDAIDAQTGMVTITHDPVASLKWPSMTMDFALANASLVAGVKPGTAVAFEFVERKPGEWVVTSVKPGVGRPRRGRDAGRPAQGGADLLNALIAWSSRNKVLVLLATVAVTLAGIYAVVKTPLDALPDLSDVQVIIYTEVPGQAPQVVEDQVTYPLTTAMLSVPKSKVVRGFSFFGASFVYVIFEDGTDIYWARSRVLEYLNFAAGRLPRGVTPQLGPDATGVGWVYQYAVMGKNRTLAELRTIQDWFIRYQLTKAPGVSEVASIGGFVQQYHVIVDPVKLRSYGVPLMTVSKVIRDSNRDVGGRVIEMAETEYMVRGRGLLRGKADIEGLVVKSEKGTPVLIRDIARVEMGPDERRGIAELERRGRDGLGHRRGPLRPERARRDRAT